MIDDIINETIDVFLKDLFTKQTIGGVFGGWSSMAWFVLLWVYPEYRYDTYGLFLVSFSLYLLVFWWYPIYSGDDKND